MTNRRTSFMTTLLSLLILLLLFLAPHVAANQHGDVQESSDRKIVTVPAGEVINHDYFAFGESVEISGTVNGDVYAAGGHVLVDGQINGDLLAVGGKVTISGTISQDARIAGGEVIISGNIGRNVTVGSGNMELTPNAVIQGGVVAGSGNIHVAGSVGRNITMGGGNMTISGNTTGNIKAAAGAIRLTSNAKVSGDLTYWSQSSASIDTQANISGHITKASLPKEFVPQPEDAVKLFLGLKLFWVAANFTSTLILGLLLIHFYPTFSHRAIAHLKEQPLSSAGLGFLVLILTPVLVGILGITLVGFPLAFLLVAVFLIYLYVGRIFVIAWTGHLISRRLGKEHSEKWAFVIGLILYSLLTLIPVLGNLVTFLAILFGLGTLLLIKKEVYIAARNHEMT